MKSSAHNSINGQELRAALEHIRDTVERMLALIEAPGSTSHDRERACDAIRDALATRADERAMASFASGGATDFDSQEAAFAERLRELMKSRGITQAELASRVGCSQPAISLMLKRHCRPQKTTIVSLASALNVDPRDLWPDLDVADILDAVAAVQQDETMPEAEADAVRRAMQRPVDAPAAPLPKRKR